MQKAQHNARLLHLPALGMIICVAASLLIFTTVPVYAGEPEMTLAMNSASANHPAPLFTSLASGSDSLYFHRQTNPPEVAGTNSVTTNLLIPVTIVESQTNSLQDGTFLLLRGASRANSPVTVDAGYRQIWDEKSTLQKICSDYQDPSYAYVSASFSF